MEKICDKVHITLNKNAVQVRETSFTGVKSVRVSNYDLKCYPGFLKG